MKALDTNVLVRFLVKDDEQQAKTVYRLFKQAESKAEAFFIPTKSVPVLRDMMIRVSRSVPG
jgi:predicted nucleic-acid-binding protein